MVKQPPTLYHEVTKIAEDYFGPAAPRFMGRLITYHLQKAPEEIDHNDLEVLSSWTQLAVSMITEEEAVIEEFVDRLKSLSDR